MRLGTRRFPRTRPSISAGVPLQDTCLRLGLGLLSEEYDSNRRRQISNFPQAFSHLALIMTP